jgi:macrolide-specific efflux system membrane fusion protein
VKKMVIAGVVLIVLAGVGFAAYKRFRGGENETTYKSIPVKRGDLRVTILSTGTVSPENRLDIKPPIAGRVEKILVNEGAKVRKGQTLAWMSSTERAALLDAATSKGAEELKVWEDMYKPTPILAPINGTIILRSVEAGQTFTATDAIFTMSDRLTVKAQVDETDISQIKLKQKAMIVLDAYSKERIPAIVDQIAFDAKTVNNVTTYLVDVLPEKTPEYMRSGMTANVTFDVDTKENVLLIPSDALKVSGNQMTVLVPGAEPKENPVEKVVRTGLTDGKRVEVLEGLEENDIILVPEFRLAEKKSGGKSPFGPPSPPKRR